MRGSRAGALAVTAGLLLGACSSGGSADKAATGNPNVVTVITTSTQRPVVDRLAATFTSENPGLTVTPANVDDPRQITAAVTGKAVQMVIAPRLFLGNDSDVAMGRNLAVIAVTKADPAGVTGPDAFAATSGLRTRICGRPTIVGNFTLFVLARANVRPNPATVVNDPTCPQQAIADVAAGRLDAALMFRNNTMIPEGVKFIDVPDNENILIDYGAAVLGTGTATTKFAKFLTSDRAKEILTQNGYLP